VKVWRFFSKDGYAVKSASTGNFLQLSNLEKYSLRLAHRKAKEKCSARSVEDSKIAENGFAARSLSDHGIRYLRNVIEFKSYSKPQHISFSFRTSFPIHPDSGYPILNPDFKGYGTFC
jgi:hypothetical protein